MGSGVKMKAIILITMWKRPEITEYVFKHYHKMQKELASEMELTLLAVGSEGKISRDIAEKNGFDYLAFPNRPLNRKYNAGFLFAERYNPDMVFFVDSDAIISKEYFQAMKTRSQPKTVFGLLDYYFLDLLGRKLGYWSGYPKGMRHGDVVGPARCFSKKVLDKISWQILPSVLNAVSGNDWHCRERLHSFNINLYGYKMDQLNCFGMDIKSGVNFYSWDKLKFAEIIEEGKLLIFLGRVGFADALDIGNAIRRRTHTKGRVLRSDISLFIRYGQNVPVCFRSGEFVADAVIEKFDISSRYFISQEEIK